MDTYHAAYWSDPCYTCSDEEEEIRYSSTRILAHCWLQRFPQLWQVCWMSFGWWPILDTHRKLLSVKTQQHWSWHKPVRAPGTYHHTPFKVTLNLLSCPFIFWMAHIHDTGLNCLKANKSFFNPSSTMIEVDLTSDINKGSYRSPGFTWSVCHGKSRWS